MSIIRYGIPSRPHFFIGRQKLLVQIHEFLTAPRQTDAILILSGAGGIGKTFIAIEYVHSDQSAQEFERIIYATTGDNLKNAFISAALQALGLEEERKEIDDVYELEFVINELKKCNGNNLFVFDNLNDRHSDDLRVLKYSFSETGWKFLIISRVCIDGFQSLNVNQLDLTDAFKLFAYHYYVDEERPSIAEQLNETISAHVKESEDRLNIEKLLNHTQSHTLLVELVAKVGKHKKLSVAELISKMEKLDYEGKESNRNSKIEASPKRGQPLSAGTLGDYLVQFLDTVPFEKATGISAIDQLNKELLEMLRFFSILPSVAIPMADLVFLWTVDQSELNQFEDKLDQLSQLGWLQRARRGSDTDGFSENAAYTMHPLIQSIVLEKLKPRIENCRPLLLNITGMLNKPLHPSIYREYASSVFDKLMELEPVSKSINHIDFANLMLALSDSLKETGQLNSALDYANRAAAIFKKLESVAYIDALSQMLSLYLALGDLDKALLLGMEQNNLCQEFFSKKPPTVDIKYRLAISYRNLGDIHRQLGDMSRSFNYFDKYYNIANQLSTDYPENIDFQNSLAISCTRLGELLKKSGDISSALYYFERHFEIATRINGFNPEDDELRDSLANVASKLGELYLEKGEYEKALTYFQNQKDIYQSLSEIYPNRLRYKENLAISYEKLGLYYYSINELDKSLSYIERDVEISRELYLTSPENIAFSEGLSIALQKLGNIYNKLNILDKALEYHVSSLQLIKALVKNYPGYIRFKNGVGIAYSKQGTIFLKMGRLEAALSSYREYYEIQKELNQKYHEEIAFKNGFAIACSKLGELYEALLDDVSAMYYYKEYNRITGELFDSNVDNVEFKHAYAISSSNLAKLYLNDGNTEAAIYWGGVYYELEKELKERYPQNLIFKNSFSIACSRLGSAYLLMRNLHSAIQYFEQYYIQQQDLLKDSPDNYQFRNGVSIACSRLSEVYIALGHHQKALQFAYRAIDLAKVLNHDFPDILDFEKSLAIAKLQIGDLLLAMNQSDLALTEFEGSNAHLRNSLQKFSQSNEIKNLLAVSFSRLGECYMNRNRPHDAIKQFLAQTKISEELYKYSEKQLLVGYNLAIGYEKIAVVYYSMDDIKTALPYFEKSKHLLETIHRHFPDDVESKHHLAVACFRYGVYNTNYAPAKLDTRDSLLQAKELWVQLAQQYPEEQRYQQNLSLLDEFLNSIILAN